MFLPHIHTFLKALNMDTSLLEVPQDRSMGDFAYPCFSLAKQYKKSPVHIASDIEIRANKLLGDHAYISRVVATGPYINIFLDTYALSQDVLDSIHVGGNSFGSTSGATKKVLIESPGPNTNKPLHLGHVRNMLLGNSLTLLIKATGAQVTKVDIVNDRGIHICKSMLAYQKFGNGAVPNKKSDHYVGDWYVRYDTESKVDESMQEDIKIMLQKWESGDPDVRALWLKMRERSLDGMHKTYAKYDCHIQKAYFESDHYLKGKDIVEEGLQSGLFHRKENGNIVYEDTQLGEKVVLRSDGTAIYITQDLALAKVRYDDRNMDDMVYVVGNEQQDHFKFLFSILEKQGHTFAAGCHHMSYGMIELPDGKMKSREGNVVDADTLLEDMIEQSKLVILQRHPEIAGDELTTRSHQIAMGAIKFFILKYDAKKNFVFDKNESLRFDGESGPYIQYTAVRCAGIIRKSPYPNDSYDPKFLKTGMERQLLLHLSDFEQIIADAANKYQPYLIARYVLDLAQLFNTYYQKTKILDENEEVSRSRLALVRSVRQVLKNGLHLLGIEIPTRM